MLIPIIKESERLLEELNNRAILPNGHYYIDLSKIKSHLRTSQLALLEGQKEQGEEIMKSPAYINLTTQWGQCDYDGVVIAVSRQALEETITAITKHFSSLEESITYLKSLK